MIFIRRLLASIIPFGIYFGIGLLLRSFYEHQPPTSPTDLMVYAWAFAWPAFLMAMVAKAIAIIVAALLTIILVVGMIVMIAAIYVSIRKSIDQELRRQEAERRRRADEIARAMGSR